MRSGEENPKFVSDGSSKVKTSEKVKPNGKDGSTVILCKNFAGSVTREETKIAQPGERAAINVERKKPDFALKCSRSFKQSSRHSGAMSSKQRNRTEQVYGGSEDSSSEEYFLTVSSESVNSVDSQKLYAKTDGA